MREIPLIDSDQFTLADFAEPTPGDLFERTNRFMGFVDDMRRKGAYTYQRPLAGPSGHRAMACPAHGEPVREMVMLASNNYLGLATHEEVVAGADDAIRRYGTGMCGSPLLNGTYDLVAELERQFADFLGGEDAMLFPSGYAANVGILSGLLRPGDVVLVDHLDHASILDGCRLSGATCRAFRHNDMDSLEKALQRVADKPCGKLVAVDGVFSMEGDVAPLPEILALARRYGARLMVDEAHALGVLGPNGAGAVDHFGLRGQVDIIMATFSKSLASTGGVVASTREVINYARYYARSYFFSASVMPGVAGGVLAALGVLRRSPELRERLWENVRYFHRGLRDLGYDVYPREPQSAILLAVVGRSADLRRVGRFIGQQGIFLNSIEFPAVPRDRASLRIGMMATHTRADLDRALAVLAETRSFFTPQPGDTAHASAAHSACAA